MWWSAFRHCRPAWVVAWASKWETCSSCWKRQQEWGFVTSFAIWSHTVGVWESQSAPPTSWSQIAEQTPGYGVTAAAGGVTTPSTSLGGMSEYVAPLPGLSIWSMPPLEASLPKGPVVSPQYQPPIGRATQLRATLNRQAPATSISQGLASNTVPAGSAAARQVFRIGSHL